MAEPKRLVVFVDYQNAYHGARRAFARPGAFHAIGQFHPLALGGAIAEQLPLSTLEQVRLYVGAPSATFDPRGNAAHQRQKERWAADGIVVRSRPLRYPSSREERTRPQEKGIDVMLAVDLLMLKMRGAYDIAAVVSADTDLIPAFIAASELGAVPVSAFWSSGRRRWNGLQVPEAKPHFLRLSAETYATVADRTDYNVAKGSGR